MSIYKKMAEVMKEVEYLNKDNNIAFGSTKYNAISEEKVTTTVRASLIKNGIVIVPVKQSHRREGTLTTVDVEYRIQNIDDDNDYIIAVSSGTGVDTQDKGVGKAMTYAYKYLLLRTFAIPTGEDPDKISSAELDAKYNKTAENSKKQTNASYEPKKVYVSNEQLHQILELGNNDANLIKNIISKFGYDEGRLIEVKDLNAILSQIKDGVKELKKSA